MPNTLEDWIDHVEISMGFKQGDTYIGDIIWTKRVYDDLCIGEYSFGATSTNVMEAILLVIKKYNPSKYDLALTGLKKIIEFEREKGRPLIKLAKMYERMKGCVALAVPNRCRYTEAKMYPWKFTPYKLDKWNNSKERILFVGSEPNGDNPNIDKLDMGHLFRNAMQNNYYNNRPFFTRCEIMLNGINGKNIGFGNFRFMDLKATQGGGNANPNSVLEYVINNIVEVTKYFNSDDKDFGLSPHVIVLLGNIAQSIFIMCIRNRVINDKNLKWIGMPHPSAYVRYVGLEYASKNIRQHLKPINELAEKWVYHKDNFDVWRSIFSFEDAVRHIRNRKICSITKTTLLNAKTGLILGKQRHLMPIWYYKEGSLFSVNLASQELTPDIPITKEIDEIRAFWLLEPVQ